MRRLVRLRLLAPLAGACQSLSAQTTSYVTHWIGLKEN